MQCEQQNSPRKCINEYVATKKQVTQDTSERIPPKSRETGYCEYRLCLQDVIRTRHKTRYECATRRATTVPQDALWTCSRHTPIVQHDTLHVCNRHVIVCNDTLNVRESGVLHDTGELQDALHDTGELPGDLHDTGEVPNALSIIVNTLLRVQVFPGRFLTVLTLRIRVRPVKIIDQG